METGAILSILWSSGGIKPYAHAWVVLDTSSF